MRRDNGITWLELDEDALRQQEPALDRRYRFAVLVEHGGNVTDPGGYVAALAAHAVGQGAVVQAGRATGFAVAAGRLRAVVTEAGEIACDAAVIAAGARSRELAAAAGDRVSLETERGYHVVVSDPGVALRHPMLTSDTKAAVVSTAAGLRVAGTVELAGLAAAPDWQRAEMLRAAMLRTIPGLKRDLPAERFRVWMGHRPSTPDGLPGAGGPADAGAAMWCRRCVHGHVGLAAGAMTGRVVADLVSGKTPSVDIAPFSPRRFH